ncbi:MAG: flagellar brake protein [Nitrospinae bacterium]|nr:flagellar brake protein [Nitrospinota bacterium]
MSPPVVNVQHSVANISGASFGSAFPIGEPVQLEFKETKYNTFLRGALAGKYVLVDIPVVGGKYANTDYNMLFTLRFVTSGSAYGFTSYLMRSFPKQGLLALEYPESIKKLSLRSSDRIKMLIPVKILIKDREGTLEGAILDLSPEGALIAVNETEGIASGQRLKLSMVLPNEKLIKSIVGIICNVKKSGAKTLLGVNFSEKDEASLSMVAGFYNECRSFLPDSEGPEYDEDRTFALGQEIKLEYGKKKATTFLRGWKTGERGYILSDPPPIGQLPGPLEPGAELVVRSVRCGNLFGVEGRFAGVLEKVNLWVFGIQADILKFPLRSDIRSYCLIPVVILSESGGKLVEHGKGMIFNLSMGGAKLITKSQAPAEGYLRINFSLGFAGKVMGQKMKIVRSRVENYKYEYAGAFVGMNREEDNKLRQFFEFCKNW